MEVDTVITDGVAKVCYNECYEVSYESLFGKPASIEYLGLAEKGIIWDKICSDYDKLKIAKILADADKETVDSILNILNNK